ncbi:MAG TPA: nucleotidyl transferase AbiEii/AbiGii toxin family protein, partial [Gemmatirosa sp.]
IARFSEDLDLSIPRAALGFAGAADLTPGLSRTQAGRRLDDMRAACEAAVAGPLAAALRARMATALSDPAEENWWDLAVAPDESGTLLFRYPAALPAVAYGAAAYIRPTVRLEFGGRNEVWPAEAHRVRPYALAAFPALSADPWAAVQVLAAERTFWEKATILHAEYYRPATSRRGERLSRHYADLAALARGDVGSRALARLDLLAAVAAHKARYFPAGWARYDEARPGTLRLVPHPELERALRRDYAAMREMYFEAAPAFDAVLDTLRRLEQDVSACRDR